MLSVSPQVFGLVFVIVFSVFIIVFTVSARVGRRPSLRPLPGFQSLPEQMGSTIEGGQKLHISMGTGSIWNSDAATTLAGLAVLQSTVDQAIAAGAPPIATTADPTALILAQDVLRRACDQQGNPADYDPLAARMVAASPFPYAAGAGEVLATDNIATNVMIGVFGPEAAFMAEEGARRDIHQVAGTTDIAGLAALYPSTDQMLIGEEIFAAGAYMAEQPAGIGSLVAQDAVRLILVVVLGLLGLAQIGTLLTSRPIP